MPLKHSELNLFETLKTLYSLRKKLKLLAFFPLNSWPYSVSNSPFCLTYVLNCKGAQQMRTMEDQATIASNSGVLQASAEAPQAAEGCCLSKKVPPVSQNSLGAMWWSIKRASRFLLQWTGPRFSKGNQVLLHSSLPPNKATQKEAGGVH